MTIQRYYCQGCKAYYPVSTPHEHGDRVCQLDADGSCSWVREPSASPAGYTADFARGVVYALARVVEMYDEPTVARSVLDEASISNDDLRKCAEYDLAFLRKEDSGIPKGV
ncbi:MAG: hypothetical protein KZQ94_15870 [Candidatus Thiodiazotropha sp. (ex Troendleina suluensis)]|nr:hypothetical protein [Candidatus Thiodiazotropha sp. (ex Troendleina suluensis)]